jgi:hypothetical protein
MSIHFEWSFAAVLMTAIVSYACYQAYDAWLFHNRNQ